MTVRLYRDDSFRWRFTAHVREQLTIGEHPAIVLDQTAFYPTAGGQPNDLGSLNGVSVIDVIEREDGEIVHVLSATLGEGHTGLAIEVEGVIDGARRVDHMQQHSGQHVLSQAFVTTGNLDTIAVHIGAGDCTLDLPVQRLTPDDVERSENEANRIVFENRALIVRELTDDAVAQLPLRKPPKVSGLIRIVEVEGFDWSACGGTHVQSSGQIGIIKVTRTEKRGATTRVYFRCGGRALADYRELGQMAASLGESFRMARAEILPAIERLRDDAKMARKELAEAQERLLEYEVQELLRQSGSVIARAFTGRDANTLKLMAKRLTSDTGSTAVSTPQSAVSTPQSAVSTSRTALLASYADGRLQLCFAHSVGARTDVAALLRGALATLNSPGAKGGGSPEFAQGSGPASDATTAQIALDWAIHELEKTYAENTR